MLINFLCVMIIKTYIFSTFHDFSWYFSFAHFDYYQNLVIWLYSSNLIFCVCSVALRKKSGELFFFFLFFNKIQDGRRITCYSEELELLHRFVSRKQLTLVICWLDFGVILKSHFHIFKNLVTVLYFSIINVLCGAGGDASFAPQANLVFSMCESSVMLL